jgi:anti-sigma-K factor RskA
MTGLSEDDIALAGEFALGLLDPAENAAAQARLATDMAFAAEVEDWRRRLQSMVEGSNVEPPDHIWRNLERSLPAPSGQDNGKGRLRFWQAMTVLSASAAAFLGFISWQQQQPAAPTSTPQIMTAALGSDTGKNAIAARYNPQTGELLMTPVSLDTGDLHPEIWIVPADGQARSLGMIAENKPSQIIVNPEMRAFMKQGAMLAITPEPEGGAPGGKATGPIIASGKITTI